MSLPSEGKPRVAFCSPLWARGENIQLGWSDYWRLALPAVELARNGWDVVLARGLAPGPGGRFLVDDGGGFRDDRDIVVFHRWMSKHAAELIARAREGGQVIVNDLDDHFWALPDGHPAIQATDPERDPDYNRENYRLAICASDLITVSTPFLAEVVADWGPEVKTVRNYIDLRAWPARVPGDYIGWVGSTAGRAEDLESLRAFLVPWLQERKLPFYHGGAVPGEPKMKEILGYPEVIVREAKNPLAYPRLWDPLRVALCPLGDTLFARSKSWVKPLEACARGIPFIASDQGEYLEFPVGRIAASPKEWAWHLEMLEDPAVYGVDMKTNRAVALRHSIEGNWHHWAEVLEGAVQPKEEEKCPTLV